MPRFTLLVAIGLLLVGTAQAPAQQNEQAAKAAPVPVKLNTGPTYEYVQQAASMKFDGKTLTLNGLAPSTIFFSDAPYRLAGAVDLKTFTGLWDGNGPFANTPPNAALSVLGKPGDVPAIVELTSAQTDGNGIKYGVKTVSGKLPDSAENVALFIDHARFHGGPRAGVLRVGNTHVGYVRHPYHPLPGPYCYHAPQAPECHYLHPYHPIHPYYPWYRPYYPYHPAAVAGAAAAGAAVGAAVASQPQPVVYVYPIPSGPLPANCYINSSHTRMICSVPIKQ
ncbi:MAG: hypothetical protein MPJ78_04495 [Hyphomicrobiaceae bacterium]|nr:hypothetical protein [Hyphomicrobiaceae bacterium]